MVPGRNLQGGGTVGVTLWKRDLGGDQGYSQGPDGVPPSGGAIDHGDEGETWVRHIVVLSSSRGCDGLRGDPPHQIIHQEVEDGHSGEGGLPACLCIIYGGGEDAEGDPGGALVGSIRDK